MKVKTYGVQELTEWHGRVKAGTIEVAVSFTGGTSSPSGAQPAYFVTKDPITQFVIENSKEFKNGFIILLMSQDIPGNHPRMAVSKATHRAEANQPAAEQVKEAKADKTDAAETEQPDEGVQEILTHVEVSCLQDAQAYLQDHYNIASSRIRGYEKAQKAAMEHGICFTGGGFDESESGVDSSAG